MRWSCSWCPHSPLIGRRGSRMTRRGGTAPAYDDRLAQRSGHTKKCRLKRDRGSALVPLSLNHLTGLDAQAEIFDFQVVFDAVLGTFTAQARGLDAAERRDFVGDQPGVDTDHAVFQGLGHTEYTAQVTGVEVGGQAELGVVGHRDHFGFVLEAEQRRQWTEGFFLGHGGVLGDVDQDGRLEEVAFDGLAAGQQGRAFAQGVGDVFLDLGHGLLVDQRAGGGAFVQTVADLELGDRHFQLLGERVVDRILDVQAVGADAGLAVVAVFGNDRAFDGLIQVRVVEHDERRIAAQFQGNLLDVLGAFGHQLATDLGRAGEGQFAHDRVAGQLAADVAGAAGDHAEHAFRDTGTLGQFGQGEGRERGLRSGLEHHGATGGQGRAGFTGDHRGREVPRGDGGGDTNRLLDHDQALVRLVARNHITVDTLGFFGEPFDEGSGVDDFALGFGQWLALFEGHQAGQVVLVLDDQLVPATQFVRTLFGGQGTPGGQGLVSGLDGATGFGSAHLWHSTQDFARGRVVDLDRLTIVRVDPSPVDIGLLAEQLGVFELHVGFP